SQGEYKYGKKVGKWIITDYYGTLKEHYNKDGKLTGVRERYNEKGELTLREHYKSGEKNGEYLEYKDGKLVVKGQYTKGRRQGEWRESQGYAPYRAVKGRYQNGVRVGKWRIYSPNGYLRGIEFYNNEGLMDGLLVTFSQEGALAQVVQYKNDRRHGKSWSYKSGKPFSIAVYEQGEMKEKRYKDDFKLSEFP
ncbi:MAG: toxin-antitoxin system YwqK family antitoxin, partial [Pseudoalteromonas sp.]